ncbi:MAG: HAD family hydrolase [Eubacteriales bacterium]|nr:HAD family hydrolase [Eubacteriales bacterium]
MKGIIFDIDGTLWDSSEVIAEAYNSAISEHLEHIDTRISGADVKRNLGKPTDAFIKGLYPTLTAEEQKFITPHFCTAILIALEKHSVPLFEGVKETFHTLSKQYELFIVSNCQCGYIEALLKGTGLGKYVKDYLSNGDTGKPKGTNIQLLMERNHLTEAVYIGDTKGDQEACKEAGVPFIWAAYGFGHVTDAKASIQKITDLIHYPF